MKISKQEIAIIGVLIAVFVAIVLYGVFAFGGKEAKNVRHEFEAPQIVRNETKEDYNSRLKKELRNEPEKPKEIDQEVLLNPFDDQEQQQELTDSSEFIALAFIPEEETPEREQQAEKNPAPSLKPKPRNQKMINPKKVKTVVVVEEPEEEPEQMEFEEIPAEMMITKRRYSQQTDAGLQSINNNLKASVYGQQKVYNKSLLKMRLLSPLVLTEEVVIPRNTFIYGVIKYSSERVNIDIKSITYRDVIYPVKYTVCDANDGLEGIFVGGDVINDLADETNTTLTSEALSSTGMRIISDIGQEVKTWTKKKSVTILNEHNLFLK